MGKRSNFPKIPRDLYETWDPKAMPALLPHLKPHTKFAEPCAGNMALARQLEAAGHVIYWCSDIDGREVHSVSKACSIVTAVPAIDALKVTTPLTLSDCIITNPPYSKNILFPLLEHFISMNETWLLLDADFMHNKGSVPYMDYCSDVASIGRLTWVRGTKPGKQNYAWFRFKKERSYTVFHPRVIFPRAKPE